MNIGHMGRTFAQACFPSACGHKSIAPTATHTCFKVAFFVAFKGDGGGGGGGGGGGVTKKHGGVTKKWNKRDKAQAPSRLSSETVVDNHPAPPATADVQPAADGVRHQPPEYPYSAPCHNFARLHVLRLLSFSVRPMPRRRKCR